MENRQWLRKRTSCEKSPGETGSLGSTSSHSEISDDQQEVLNLFPNGSTQSPKVTSKTSVTGQEVNDFLTEKLSAALVNINAKEDLVKQHAKVAEEAIAGWEKANNEIVVLKQQLGSAVQKSSALEDRVSHLDQALKECVRQLRQAREEHEGKIHEAIREKTSEWESTKLELESQLLKLKTQAVSTKIDSPAAIDPDLHLKLKFLEKENAALKLEIHSQSKELEIQTIERDLSTKAAEAASKQHLESIKKMAKLEAECRRMQVASHKLSTVNNHKSVAASPIYVESLTDSQSDRGEWLDAVEIDTLITSRLEQNAYKPSCTASWASALIAKLDQFKKEKTMSKNSTACSIEIDIMNDFLEMEQLAALPDNESQINHLKSEPVPNKSAAEINSLKAELDTMIHRIQELEEKLEKIEAEKAELGNSLTATQDFLMASEVHLMEAEIRSKRLQKELSMVNESKELLEFQLIDMQVEAQTLCAEVDSLQAEANKERSLSAEMAVMCRELEGELMRKIQEVEFHQTTYSDGKLKVKDEAIAIAAGKLAECQKTIASLGRQLKTLATLEDFLIDSGNLPRFTGGEELWKLHYNDTFYA